MGNTLLDKKSYKKFFIINKKLYISAMNKNTNIKNGFEVIGYFEEYLVDNKFIGTKRVEFDPSRSLGWAGRKTFYAAKDIILDRGKKIKAGTKYYTYLQQLCGKYHGTQKEKINAIQQSQAWKLRAQST